MLNMPPPHTHTHLFGCSVCNSMDHWFAPIKQRSELGFAAQAGTPASCLSSVGQCSPNMVWCRSQPRERGLITLVIRCSGRCHIPWLWWQLMESRWHTVSHVQLWFPDLVWSWTGERTPEFLTRRGWCCLILLKVCSFIPLETVAWLTHTFVPSDREGPNPVGQVSFACFKDLMMMMTMVLEES